MGECSIVRRGGGASLNFKVVGGTSQPTSTKENTVWVNTEADITGWSFSATAPESPVEGMMWFKTGGTSSGAFNALKKNTLMVYIVGVSQYISGKWTSKVSEIYQNGAWVEFITYVFKNGNIGLGGGIVINSGSTSDLVLSDVITLTCPQNSDRSWRTAEPIDVTAFKTMRISGYTPWAGTSGTVYTTIGLATSSQLATANSYTAFVGVPYSQDTPQEVSIDISSLEGNYYVVFWWHSASGTGTQYLKTYYVEFDV